MKHLLLFTLSSLVASLLADSAVDSLLEKETLEAEHRSAAEPKFLDRIASLFGAGTSAPKIQPVKKTGPAVRPQGPYRPPVSPVYRPQAPPPRRQAVAPSYQTPVAVKAPPGHRRQQFVPPSAGIPTRQHLSPVPPLSNQINSQPALQRVSTQADPWQSAQPANMAQIKDLQVQCEKDLMRVRVVFDRPFYGMVFSKGHYSNVNCVHVPSGLGQTTTTFDIAMGQCGMSTGGNEGHGAPTPQGSFIENTIIVQYDPLLQEVWDQARKLRCTWYDFYEKAVTFHPFGVDMLDPVTANFLGDNLRCWMQIQVGKGPHASEVSGIVKIGQTMTMVLGVKDDENKFDMMVRNCVAHDGRRAPIQLVDEKGCVVRDKIMSPFKKMKNFDSTANVLSFAYFQAFKFPDSMNVHFQCVVQVCRSSCPAPQCGPGVPPTSPPYQGGSSNNIDSYGAPQASPQSLDSYGSPQAGPINRIDNLDPRIPLGGLDKYQASGSDQKLTVVHPETRPQPNPIPLALLQNNNLPVPKPGYNNFNKRVGVEESIAGGRPRSLEQPETETKSLEFGEDESGENTERKAKQMRTDDDEERLDEDNSVDEKNRRRRSSGGHMTDANGNRILSITKRETGDETSADIETERVIRVLAPSDVQFQFGDPEDKEKIVVDTEKEPLTSESLCMDTAAFVGIAISFLMILIVALIVIVFLWLRIRAIGRKNVL